MRLLSLLAVLFTLSLNSFAQKGKIEGKVTDANSGKKISGASVIVNGSKTAVATNTDGYFVLSLDPGKNYTIQLSSVGYNSKEISEIEVVADKVFNIEIILEPSTKTESEVVVRSTARKSTEAALISYQKNTNTVASVISSESIRRSPDKNTGEVLKRTPGASIQEGRFIVVRGLADRYNQAMLNGILLTSTEPDRKTFSFDLIPAAMIDNIIINKAFVPEYPGEWAGGLIQVNTKDIPAQGFFTIQIGTGFNTQTVGKKFYTDNGGGLDWLGLDDGTRALPESYTTKSNFDILSSAEKTAIGKEMRNAWAAKEQTAPLNINFQTNGGFNTKLFGKTIGGTFGLNYSKTNRYLNLLNRSNTLSNNGNSNDFSVNYDYDDDRYQQDVSVGALGSIAMQLNSSNKISLKSIVNINSANSVIQRSGTDFTRDDELKGSEFTFKQNTFFTVQAAGDHNIKSTVKLKWYGAFNILDGYVPDQRRISYSKAAATDDPYRIILANTLSQQSGSRIYQNLSDYIYTAGGDISYPFTLFKQKQAIKAGYMLQIKDRLYDAKLFANYLPLDNSTLRLLPANEVFAAQNFGDGSATSNLIAFDAIKGNTFRYLANTILNAGFLQFDNQLSDAIRIVWGLRVESFDQLVGSVKKWDPRHSYTKVTDYLPGINATYKLNAKTNFRLSGSQTVIRPELRELSFLNLYDFELNASVQGYPALKRTKVTNLDFRYEVYPKSGEVFTAGIFYKNFSNPIEQIFDEAAGGASTFTYRNANNAKSYGVELEVRKKLEFMGKALKNFTFQANGSYIYSNVKDENLGVDRPMQGQSPYVLNAGLLYDHSKSGITATLLYNQIGKRIYVVGLNAVTIGGSPDIYEASRPLLDFQITKKVINNKAEIRLSISDILNQTQYFYQNADDNAAFEKGKDAYRFTRKFGTTFGITFNYSL